jgi:hypothetical protein
VQPGGRRRSKLNFSSFDAYGTVEFRQHPGSTSPVEKAAWLKFVNEFAAASASMVSHANPAHKPRDRELTHLKNLVTALKNDRVARPSDPQKLNPPQI